jgi:hypothetical protein
VMTSCGILKQCLPGLCQPQFLLSSLRSRIVALLPSVQWHLGSPCVGACVDCGASSAQEFGHRAWRQRRCCWLGVCTSAPGQLAGGDAAKADRLLTRTRTRRDAVVIPGEAQKEARGARGPGRGCGASSSYGPAGACSSPSSLRMDGEGSCSSLFAARKTR